MKEGNIPGSGSSWSDMEEPRSACEIQESYSQDLFSGRTFKDEELLNITATPDSNYDASAEDFASSAEPRNRAKRKRKRISSPKKDDSPVVDLTEISPAKTPERWRAPRFNFLSPSTQCSSINLPGSADQCKFIYPNASPDSHLHLDVDTLAQGSNTVDSVDKQSSFVQSELKINPQKLISTSQTTGDDETVLSGDTDLTCLPGTNENDKNESGPAVSVTEKKFKFTRLSSMKSSNSSPPVEVKRGVSTSCMSTQGSVDTQIIPASYDVDIYPSNTKYSASEKTDENDAISQMSDWLSCDMRAISQELDAVHDTSANDDRLSEQLSSPSKPSVDSSSHCVSSVSREESSQSIATPQCIKPHSDETAMMKSPLRDISNARDVELNSLQGKSISNESELEAIDCVKDDFNEQMRAMLEFLDRPLPPSQTQSSTSLPTPEPTTPAPKPTSKKRHRQSAKKSPPASAKKTTSVRKRKVMPDTGTSGSRKSPRIRQKTLKSTVETTENDTMVTASSSVFVSIECSLSSTSCGPLIKHVRAVDKENHNCESQQYNISECMSGNILSNHPDDSTSEMDCGESSPIPTEKMNIDAQPELRKPNVEKELSSHSDLVDIQSSPSASGRSKRRGSTQSSKKCAKDERRTKNENKQQTSPTSGKLLNDMYGDLPSSDSESDSERLKHRTPAVVPPGKSGSKRGNHALTDRKSQVKIKKLSEQEKKTPETFGPSGRPRRRCSSQGVNLYAKDERRAENENKQQTSPTSEKTFDDMYGDLPSSDSESDSDQLKHTTPALEPQSKSRGKRGNNALDGGKSQVKIKKLSEQEKKTPETFGPSSRPKRRCSSQGVNLCAKDERRTENENKQQPSEKTFDDMYGDLPSSDSESDSDQLKHTTPALKPQSKCIGKRGKNISNRRKSQARNEELSKQEKKTPETSKGAKRKSAKAAEPAKMTSPIWLSKYETVRDMKNKAKMKNSSETPPKERVPTAVAVANMFARSYGKTQSDKQKPRAVPDMSVFDFESSQDSPGKSRPKTKKRTTKSRQKPTASTGINERIRTLTRQQNNRNKIAKLNSQWGIGEKPDVPGEKETENLQDVPIQASQASSMRKHLEEMEKQPLNVESVKTNKKCRFAQNNFLLRESDGESSTEEKKLEADEEKSPAEDECFSEIEVKPKKQNSNESLLKYRESHSTTESTGAANTENTGAAITENQGAVVIDNTGAAVTENTGAAVKIGNQQTDPVSPSPLVKPRRRSLRAVIADDSTDAGSVNSTVSPSSLKKTRKCCLKLKPLTSSESETSISDKNNCANEWSSRSERSKAEHDMLNGRTTEPGSTAQSSSDPDQDVKKKIVICCSGLNKQDKQRVEKCVTILGASFSQNFSSEVTHLVTSVNPKNHCARTIKYLLAVLRGIWIVSPIWADICVEDGKKVDEEPFEVLGCSIAPGKTTPRQSRLNQLEEFPRLFHGCEVYLRGQFSPPSPSHADLMHILETGGAKILKKEPISCCTVLPHHLKDCSKHSIKTGTIILSTKERPRRSPEGALFTSPTWLLDCIARYEIIEPPNQK